METPFLPACMLSCILFAGCATQPVREPPLCGGYSAAALRDEQVIAAAAFAVEAQREALRRDKGTQPGALVLVKILDAQQQVVAGVNYRLRLKVRLDGRDREAEALVWWQAWRLPDPYKLTSWDWR